jgi:hypothetical protein
MFVTNHVLSGVVVGRLLERHPVAAFVVGVGSHLALDMVPHWGCEGDRALDNDLFLRYAKRDGLLGLATAAGAVAAVPGRARPATVAAIAGAVLLDMDKPVQHFWGRVPFPAWVQRIHVAAQNESSQGLPNEIVFGLSCAAVDAVIAWRGRRGVSRRVEIGGAQPPRCQGSTEPL